MALECDGGQNDALVARPKLFALFTFLVAHGSSRFHQRDTLLAVFWPESDEDRARNNLRQSLHQLRRVLDDRVIIRRGRTQVGVDGARVDCDVLAFQAALNEGCVADALAIYHGDFLEGFHAKDAPAFDDWVDRERVRLRSLAGDAARTIAEKAEEEGRFDDAIREWNRVRVLEPFDERALKRLLWNLMKAGKRAEALMQYRRFVRQRAELGLTPSAEIASLMRSEFPVHASHPTRPSATRSGSLRVHDRIAT